MLDVVTADSIGVDFNQDLEWHPHYELCSPEEDNISQQTFGGLEVDFVGLAKCFSFSDVIRMECIFAAGQNMVKPKLMYELASTEHQNLTRNKTASFFPAASTAVLSLTPLRTDWWVQTRS